MFELHKRAKSWMRFALLSVSAFGAGIGFHAHAADTFSILRRGNLAEPDFLDPHLASTSWENNIIGDLLVGLTTEDPEAKPIPGAAESWTVSDDGLVWTFKLRPGLVWSDGVPLKASDFVFAFRRLMDPKTAARYASVEYVIKNAEAVNNGKMPLEALGVRAVDDRTVEFTLDQQAPFFAGLMKHYTALPIPEHIYKKYGEAWVKPGNMVSDGPFKLESWNPHDMVKIVKNPRFYDAKNVHLDEVDFLPIDDEGAALTRFRAREIDMNIGTRGFPISQYDWLKDNMPGEARITSNLANEYIVMNMRRAPFNDVRVRQAVSLCIDREILANKVSRDRRVPAYSFVPPGIANYHNTARAAFADWTPDRRHAEAKRLLAQAGYSPDHPLEFEYLYDTSVDQRRSAIAEAAMMHACGIIVHPIANEAKVHYNMIQEGDFVAAWASWIADYNDPQNFLYLLDSRSGVFNYGGYNNPAFDRLMDEAKATLDLEKRAALMAEAEQVALDDAAVAPLAFITSKELVANYVKGFKPNPEDIYRSRWLSVEPH